jgi:uncharacterized membrane protein YoaK (UPF0700 family)
MPPAIDAASERRNLRPVHLAVERSVATWWRHQWDVICAFALGAAIGGALVWAIDHLAP